MSLSSSIAHRALSLRAALFISAAKTHEDEFKVYQFQLICQIRSGFHDHGSAISVAVQGFQSRFGTLMPIHMASSHADGESFRVIKFLKAICRGFHWDILYQLLLGLYSLFHSHTKGLVVQDAYICMEYQVVLVSSKVDPVSN